MTKLVSIHSLHLRREKSGTQTAAPTVLLVSIHSLHLRREKSPFDGTTPHATIGFNPLSSFTKREMLVNSP